MKPVSLLKELIDNRALIWKLSWNDFKKRYAGSYLGFAWALVPPVVTVLMYWFVFDIFFGQKAQLVKEGIELPYVVYLTAGLVPWFFFTEALQQATNALLEYVFLVKQVVFKISILPLIKVTAAVFVHAFFIVVMLAVAAVYGMYPSIYTLQIFYYGFCLFILVLGISYATSAVVVFFRDLSHLIQVGLQIGMWATPILWNINNVASHKKLTFVLELNPMCYIVNGYRDAVAGTAWFWQDLSGTMYFWGFTIVTFIIGAYVFKKMKVHFADVL